MADTATECARAVRPDRVPDSPAGLEVPELRLDLLRGEWVLVTGSGPAGFEAGPCPLCRSTDDKGPDWQVRVLACPEMLAGPGAAGGCWLGPTLLQGRAAGVAELLVLSPDHTQSLADLDEAHTAIVMAAIADRLHSFATVDGVRCATVTVAPHDSEVGLDHLHARLAGLPVVPADLGREISGFDRFRGNCLLCAVAEAEASAGHRLVHADDRVVVVCPYWSASPYEMLVLPRRHDSHLHTAAADDLLAVGRAVRSAVRAVDERLERSRCRVTFHTAPFDTDRFHWHAHVVADPSDASSLFGVDVNTVAPEAAAVRLRRRYGAAA